MRTIRVVHEFVVDEDESDMRIRHLIEKMTQTLFDSDVCAGFVNINTSFMVEREVEA